MHIFFLVRHKYHQFFIRFQGDQQKPVLLATFSRQSKHFIFIYIYITELTPASNGQSYPAKSGQGHKNFHKITELQQEVSPFRIYIQKEVPMMENLLAYYRKSDGVTKKGILYTIFAEKQIVIKGK